MSRQAETQEELVPPKPLTVDEIIERFDPGYADRVQSFLDSIEANSKKHDEDIEALEKLVHQCLATTPKPVKDPEVEQLKQEVQELKTENANLKQQLADLWTSFTLFLEKGAQGASKKWNAFFAKNQPAKTETPVTEQSNTPSM